MTKKLPLEYIIREPKINIEKPPLMILIHGYGSNEQDLYSFASELPDELMIISVRAPQVLAHGSYSWYTINYDTVNGKFSDDDEAIASRDQLITFIDEAKKTFNTSENNTFLLGFSQGCILSYSIALNYPEKIQHVVALSGYINQGIITEDIQSKDYSNLDFFISHGSVDQVIPIDWGNKAPEFLNQLNIQNSFNEYMVGHGVSPQNFQAFKNWIQERV